MTFDIAILEYHTGLLFHLIREAIMSYHSTSFVRSFFRLLTFICLITFAWPSLLVADNISTGSKAIQQDALIPRTVLFSDPDRTKVQLSPNGQYITYLAPSQGVLNIWVGHPNNPTDFKPVTDNTKRGIANYLWAYTNQHIIYLDDKEGDENWRIYRVDVASGQKLALAAFDKVQARLLARSKDYPEEILIELNQRRSDFFDVYRLNIITGELTLVLKNDSFARVVADEHLNLKVAAESTEDGGTRYFALMQDKDHQYSKKELFFVAHVDRGTMPLLMNKTGDTLYMLDSRGRNAAALIAFNLDTQKSMLIAEDKRVDISDVLIQPTERTIQGVAKNYTKTEWTLLDNTLEPDFQYLKGLQLEKGMESAELAVVSRSLDDKNWVVAFSRDDGAPHYYFYDKVNKKAHFLFSGRPLLDNYTLNKMEPVIIPTRDKLSLISYLSRPKNKAPVPLVLLVHGGPTLRDDWGYNGIHQWLTNRGYAVLSVNYRGSSGFGKKFTNAGNGEWAGKVQHDLLDAVQWAIDKGITTKDKVAIMGGSYGGYSTLVGMTKSADTFACGVDIVGMSNLETLLRSIPPYWKPFYASMKIKIGGDPETEAGRAFLASQSPLSFVHNIKRPLLIAQGANDPRVKRAESDQIVEAMEQKHIPVTYVLYPDEGHGFARPENRLSFYAVTEAFLAQHLGGRHEPVGTAFENSSLQILKGKEVIPALIK